MKKTAITLAAVAALSLSACSPTPEQRVQEIAYNIVRETSPYPDMSDAEIEASLPFVCEALETARDVGLTWQEAGNILVQDLGWSYDGVEMIYALAVLEECPELKPFLGID